MSVGGDCKYDELSCQSIGYIIEERWKDTEKPNWSLKQMILSSSKKRLVLKRKFGGEDEGQW